MLITTVSSCSYDNLPEFSNRCSDIYGHYRVKYYSISDGEGDLTLEQGKTPWSTRVSLVVPAAGVFGAMGEKTTLVGVGECLRGAVQAQFLPTTNGMGSVSVLGGRFHGVFLNETMIDHFGRWEIDLLVDQGRTNFEWNAVWEHVQ